MIEPVPVVQVLFIVSVIDCTAAPADGLTEVAQWSSLRRASTASSDCCCAWKRLFICVEACDADAKRSPIPPRTIERMTIVVTSSGSV